MPPRNGDADALLLGAPSDTQGPIVRNGRRYSYFSMGSSPGIFSTSWTHQWTAPSPVDRPRLSELWRSPTLPDGSVFFGKPYGHRAVLEAMREMLAI